MSTKMNDPVLKMTNKQIKCHIFKWADDIKLLWNKYIQKKYYELSSVQNVPGILLKTIIKFRNNWFYKNFYSKNCRILIFFRYIVRVFLEEK